MQKRRDWRSSWTGCLWRMHVDMHAPLDKLVLVWILMVALLPVVWWQLGWIGVSAPLDNTDVVTPPSTSTESSDKRASEELGPPTKFPLELIFQYPYILDQGDQAIVPLGPGKHRKATPGEVRARQQEYHEAMLMSLIHPAFYRVHVMLNRSQDALAFYDSVIVHAPPQATLRTKFRVLGRQMTYGDAFSYANLCCAGRYVLIINSDVYPFGDGWDRLKTEHFGFMNRTVYMLSRYSPECPAQPTRNLKARPESTCERMAGYGSADGFLFRAPVPQRVVDEMKDFPTNYWGAENRAAAALRRVHYKQFLNPCKVLGLWHLHCTRVRVTGRDAPRINTGAANSVVAKFVPKLPERKGYVV